MKATDEHSFAVTANIERSGEQTVSIHSTSPDRAVLVEHGNTDGWIASDLTIGLVQ